VEGFGFQDERAVLVRDPVSEIEPNALCEGRVDFDGQDVVVPGGGPVAKGAFDDRKQGLAFLPVLKGRAQVPEKLTAGGFQKVEVAGIINVIPHRAIGIRDAVNMGETWHDKGKIGLKRVSLKPKLWIPEGWGRRLGEIGPPAAKAAVILKPNHLLRHAIFRLCCERGLGLAAGDFSGDCRRRGGYARAEQVSAEQIQF
jgi:hypothetical protein